MKPVATKILAFPTLRTIPPPEMPLVEQGYDKYMELARRLLDAGKLNIYTRTLCERIGLLHYAIYRKSKLNQVPSLTAIEQIGKLEKELQLVDQSDATAPPADRQESRFAKYGKAPRYWAEAPAIRPS